VVLFELVHFSSFECRGYDIAMPFADGGRYEVRVIAHGKMIAFGNYHLAGITKQLFPTGLKPKRIVAFAKNCK
jgi:hypothetical protein